MGNKMTDILELIDLALARGGVSLLDESASSVLIRDKETDTDYRVSVEDQVS